MKNKLLSYWVEMAATITATGVIMAFVFAVYFKPEVQKMIDPLIRKIECMTFVIGENIPQEKIDIAVKKYYQAKIDNDKYSRKRRTEK